MGKGCGVFVEGKEIACKAGSGSVKGAMPDVCLSPPSPPAGPMPIPYPGFAKSKTLSKGSKTVLVKGKPVSLKNKSEYKSSKGDKAATRNFGMGVVTHGLEGPVRHLSWSFTVKVEGQNVSRHMDLTSHNHASPMGNSGCTGMLSAFTDGGDAEQSCEDLRKKNTDKRAEVNKAATPSQKEKHRTTTITHGQFQQGAKRFSVWSASKALDSALQAGTPGQYRAGLESQRQYSRTKTAQKSGREIRVSDVPASNIDCPAAKERGFSYHTTETSAGPSPHTTHTESRIIEDVFSAFKGPGGKVSGKLRMAINWPTARGKKKPWMPCNHCENVLCAAMLCGLEIELCSREGPNAKDKEDCPDDLSPKRGN